MSPDVTAVDHGGASLDRQIALEENGATMLRPAQTAMSAYYRRRGEDRATEVIASVLDQVPALAHALVELAGLPRADAYEIQTQVRAGDVIVDLEIVGLQEDGERAWMLWSEHKVYDPLRATQLENEFKALEARAGSLPRALIAVTLFEPTTGAVSFASTRDCILLKWADISQLARRALERRPPGDLPTVADYVLKEWLEFASKELEAPVEALTPDRVKWIPEVGKALETVTELMKAAFTRGCADIGAGTPREEDEELYADPPEGSWLKERGFTLYAKFVDEGGFGDVDDPCLVFGGWVEQDDAVSARRSRDLHSALGERGLSIWDEVDRHGGWIEFGIPVSLTDLAANTSLEQQDRMAGEVCLRALRALLPQLSDSARR